MDRTARVQLVAVAVGILGASLLVWQTSGAAFTSSTATNGSFSTGTVTLTDDDGGSALLTGTDWLPGDSVSGCIEVTYGGSVDPGNPVTFSATPSDDTINTGGGGNGLSDDLKVTVDLGTSGSSCSSFSSAATLYSATALDALPTSAAPDSTGWTPTSAADTMRPFQITVTLDSATGDDAQGEVTTSAFTWAVST